MNAEEFPVVLFSSQDGDVRVNAVLRDRTLWLTQKSMAGLFGVKSQAITKHLKNIYATGELQIAATCSKMEQVQSEGGRRVAREIVVKRVGPFCICFTVYASLWAWVSIAGDLRQFARQFDFVRTIISSRRI